MKNSFLGILLILFISCGGDDKVRTPSEQLVVDLTSNRSKVWRISTASLIRENSQPVDITNNISIQDDEFVFEYFRGDQNDIAGLAWRPRNHIDIPSSTDEVSSELYSSPFLYNIHIADTATRAISDRHGKINFIINSNFEMSGSVFLDDTTRLDLDLVPKRQNEYKQHPGSMPFDELVSFSGIGIADAPGFTGSRIANALYFAHRSPNPSAGVFEDHLIRFDLTNNTMNTAVHASTDFVTKQVHYIDGQIQVITGLYFNSYDPDFHTQPNIMTHGSSLSRFGSAVLNDEIYIVGGDLNLTDSDKIKIWNEESSTFDVVGSLPSFKHWADAEIVDDKLYVFGGQETLFDAISNDIIYIYDLTTGEVETLTLPVEVFRTYTARYEHLIYVAGQINDNDQRTTDLDIFFGTFNTEDQKFREIRTNLSDEGWNTIHQMAIVGDQLYVVYGDGVNAVNGVQEFSIQVATLP